MKTSAPTNEDLRDRLRSYYGRVLKRTGDLRQQACCADDTRSRYAEITRLLPDEVVERNFGCGCAIPEDDLSGLTVLDLGCGSGFDAFILSKLVGEAGRIIGLDMTVEQLEVARRNAPLVQRAFGYTKPNVDFVEGYIECAEAVPDGSVDIVVSDCVINLSPEKERVFETIWRVLRPGGELYVSDIVADRRVPERLSRRADLVSECLGGALYEHDLFDTLEDARFRDARVVARRAVDRDVAGVPIQFFSLTFRAFKLVPALDRRCEDYGQFAIYRGGCPGTEARFRLDDHHVFESGRPVPVCRNTARMLSETRLSRWFEVTSPREHFGLFPCGPARSDPDAAGAPCC